jgi:hypothetical protein
MSILLGSLDLNALAADGTHFEFIRGGLQSLATFRGEDDIVPEAAGRDPGQWIADIRDLGIHGIVAGAGASAQAGRESFATRSAALVDEMDPATLTTIVVTAPDFGLAVGETATLSDVRPMRIVGPDPSTLGYEGWEVTLELVCIDSPPNWVLSQGS